MRNDARSLEDRRDGRGEALERGAREALFAQLRAEGTHLCERLLGYASPLKLYAEEIDVHTGRHLGNYPQAFTHLALINAVVHVIRVEEAQATGHFQPAHTN